VLLLNRTNCNIDIFMTISASVIEARLTTPSLTFNPGGTPASFGVEVINRSDKFAAFQLEILAAGARSEADWYQLTPKVSSAKPPGDRTDFRVEIVESPIPHFVGIVNLTVRVSSPQLLEERRLVLRLHLEPGAEPDLQLVLPVRRFQVYPRNRVDIPVRIKNPKTQPNSVILRLDELDPTWLVGSSERHLMVPASSEAETIFQCQPPSVNQAISKDYTFTINAKGQNGATGKTTGIVEVLPVGFIELDAQPQQRQLPIKWSWLPNWWSRQARFQLMLNNASNLLQDVDIELRGQDLKHCPIQIEPPSTHLSVGEVTPVLLTAQPRRPWTGLPRQLRFEAKAHLSDPRLGSTDPATQWLMLKVFPIVPLWLLLTILSLIGALLSSLLNTPVSHTAAVNAVRFSGTSGLVPLVLSSADDCSIRSWSMEQQGTLQPTRSPLPEGAEAKTCGTFKPKSNQGILALTELAVRPLAFIPAYNNKVFAGLETGPIQVWDVNTGKLDYNLKDKRSPAGDRVSTLAFTRNSRYLYSGYGSGTVRVWQSSPGQPFRSQPTQVLAPPDYLKSEIWALALSADEKTLVSTGQFKHIILWDLKASTPSPSLLSMPAVSGGGGANADFWSLDVAPNNTLAAADSDGYITLWNLNRCQQIHATGKSWQQLPERTCELRDRWKASQLDVKSIKFTPDGQWLVSAGNDGRIVAWKLTDTQKHDSSQKEKLIATLACKVTSIDVTTNSQGTWIVSGAEDYQVRLHHLQ
jgi:WD40 repeat protein